MILNNRKNNFANQFCRDFFRILQILLTIWHVVFECIISNSCYDIFESMLKMRTETTNNVLITIINILVVSHPVSWKSATEITDKLDLDELEKYNKQAAQ